MENKNTSKVVPFLLLLFGGLTLATAIFLLTIWLPETSTSLLEVGLEEPASSRIISYIILLFSFVQIIVGFIISRKQSSSQVLSKQYSITGKILLLMTIIIFFLILYIFASYGQSLYGGLKSL